MCKQSCVREARARARATLPPHMHTRTCTCRQICRIYFLAQDCPAHTRGRDDETDFCLNTRTRSPYIPSPAHARSFSTLLLFLFSLALTFFLALFIFLNFLSFSLSFSSAPSRTPCLSRNPQRQSNMCAALVVGVIFAGANLDTRADTRLGGSLLEKSPIIREVQFGKEPY